MPASPVPLAVPGVPAGSALPARSPKDPSGEILGRVGGDERRSAGATASLSSCQMSLKGWKNRLGLGMLRKARLRAALQLFREKSKKCTRLGSPVLPPGRQPRRPGLGAPASGVAQGAGMGMETVAGCSPQSPVPFGPLRWPRVSHCR